MKNRLQIIYLTKSFAIGYPVKSKKLPLAVLGRFQEHGPLILAVINKGQINWNVGLEIFTPIICALSNYNMVISGLDNKGGII